MGKRYRVMLIGCGHIGRQHLEDIYYRDNVQVEAVVDLDTARAAEFARRFGARQYGTDYRDYLGQVDIVIIATYASSHLSILEDCLEAGVHVLCEKPIASTLADGQRFYRLAKASSSKVLIAHILRHNQSYQTIARLIQEGAIGELKLMRMVQNHHAMDWPRYKRLMEDCSPIVDCGVHYLDVMQWFSQSYITEVSGLSCKLDADAPRDNFGVINVKLANGCVGYYEAAWSPNSAAQNLKEFVGDKGRITLTMQQYRTHDAEEGDLITLYSSATGEYTTINVQAKYKDMYAQFSTLVEMIERDTPACPTLEQAYTALYAALCAEQAIACHATATLAHPLAREEAAPAMRLHVTA